MTALQGKTALVLGANGLIGNAIATALGFAGARLILAARDSDRLHILTDTLRASGYDCDATAVDATDDTGLAALVARAASPGGLDIAINNVGSGHIPCPIGQMDIDEMDRVFHITLRSVAIAMKHELAAMNRGGAVVNIASSAGLDGAPGMSAYVAAKHGVIGLTKTAAIDYAQHGIRVNAVAPGPIASGPIMALPDDVRTRVGLTVPLGRLGSPAEVAAATLWLASPDSSYSTGSVITVDGGKLA